MSVLKWHIRKWLLILSWILVCIIVILLFPGEEGKICGLFLAVIFCGVTNKVFYHCPHCNKMIDLRLFIRQDTKCNHCGEDLVE